MNTAYPVADKLLARISRMGRGSVFSGTDVLDVGSWSAVRQALARLARKGMIRRLAPGLYHFPRINPKLGGILNPLPDAVAMAVARKTDCRVIPSGAMAANVLGLSTQVPAKVIYLTDGSPRTIRYGSQTIVFRFAAPRTMAVSGKTSAVVFQALRYLGRDGVSETVISKLTRILSAKDKRILKKDSRYAPQWMRPILSRVAEGTEDR
ncbi:MAG TPA: DUF6088 family protein [Kiritimatiellia bacterium]|nr:DUF6088 family protein [Kiritimatiellia bacterium]